MALHLAEKVRALLWSIRGSTRELVDSSNAALLFPKFWLQPIFTELLNAGCRLEQSGRRKPRSWSKLCVSARKARPPMPTALSGRFVQVESVCWVTNAGLRAFLVGFRLLGCLWLLKLWKASRKAHQDNIVPYVPTRYPAGMTFNLRR